MPERTRILTSVARVDQQCVPDVALVIKLGHAFNLVSSCIENNLLVLVVIFEMRPLTNLAGVRSYRS